MMTMSKTVKIYLLSERIKSKAFEGNTLASWTRLTSVEVDQGAWSIKVVFGKQDEKEGYFWGEVSFLVEDAPTHVLEDGAELDFLEGDEPALRLIISGEE
ncbi:hypothetical protein HC928_02140 [bacterium]|nr:hypothetical protein [bacterium]